MSEPLKSIIVGLVLCVLLSGSVLAQTPGPGRDMAFEQQVLERLTKISPEAVPLFQDATRALDEVRLLDARDGYEKVLALAPDFDVALRRLSYIETAVGLTEAALKHARAALSALDAPYNRMALAQALLATKSSASAKEALEHARLAARALPNDREAQDTLLLAGTANQDLRVVRRASGALIRIAPRYPTGHYAAGLVAASDGRWERAEKELLLARELGMEAETVQVVLVAHRIPARARLARWLRYGGYALMIWLASLGVLFASGSALSLLTLQAVRQTGLDLEPQQSRSARMRRTLYRVVLGALVAYQMLSIPILTILALALLAGSGCLMVLAGRWVWTALIVGLVAYILYSIARKGILRYMGKGAALGQPGAPCPPARPLTRDQAPALYAVAERVAHRLRVRPVQMIYIAPPPEIELQRRGNPWHWLVNHGEYALLLGLGVLSGLDQSQFESLLAHEYGRSAPQDSAGGHLAMQVLAYLRERADALSDLGPLRWLSPDWLYSSACYALLAWVAQGAWRWQELLADRRAAESYGAPTLIAALSASLRQSLAFELQTARELQSARAACRPVHNLYTLPPIADDEIAADLCDLLDAPAFPQDRHPTVQEHLAALQRLALSRPTAEEAEHAWVGTDHTGQPLVPGAEGSQIGRLDDQRGTVCSAWSLLPDVPALQAEMSAATQR